MPDRETAYLTELVSRLQALLDSELVGVYAGGSYALGDYERGRSDLDVTAVIRGPVPASQIAALVDALRHESLPCPTRGLEFVLYPLDVVHVPTTEPGFVLNLNTGPEMAFRADYQPVEGERHWFAIDRSVLAQHGNALFGPPAATVFAPIPREQILPILALSLRWFSRNPGQGDGAVLNACRALRYEAEGVWSSKPAAGVWALERLGEPKVVADALRIRDAEDSLAPERVRDFLQQAIAQLETPR